jgi:hypothetical protein
MLGLYTTADVPLGSLVFPQQHLGLTDLDCIWRVPPESRTYYPLEDRVTVLAPERRIVAGNRCPH